MSENLERIKYSNRVLNRGVEVPDTMITVGGTDTYKLLEALNIDWKNVTVPNLRKITKWNSAGIPAEGTFVNYSSQIANEINTQNNSVDWLNSNYDYLSDGLSKEYLTSNITDVYTELLPDWAKEGKKWTKWFKWNSDLKASNIKVSKDF